MSEPRGDGAYDPLVGVPITWPSGVLLELSSMEVMQ